MENVKVLLAPGMCVAVLDKDEILFKPMEYESSALTQYIIYVWQSAYLCITLLSMQSFLVT
jgi:hypothetical protein